MKVENISFRYLASATDQGTLKERVKANGMIRRVKVKFYPGQELALQVRPFVLHKNNRAEDVFTYAQYTSPFIAGDDDLFDFNVAVEIEYDDEICVQFINTNDTFDYDLVVDIEVAYYDNELEVL